MSNVIAFPTWRRRGGHEPLVAKSDVARHLGVSTRWVELRMRDGGLPHLKDPVSRLVRYRLSDVDAWYRGERCDRQG